MTTLTSTTSHTNTLMQTALVTASGPATRCQARILIDTGSQKTFITQCLKNKLQLKAVQNETLDVTTFGSTRGTPKSYEVVTLTLNAVNKDVKITALVTPIICPPLSSTQHTEIPVEFKALAFADPLDAEGDRTIDILIGNDHYARIIVGNTKKSQDERWMATQSKFGWLLSGPVPNNESSTETTLSTLCQMVGAQPTRNEHLNETLTKFWEINKLPDEYNAPEVTDVQKHFQDTIEFNKVTGRYNVRLPWKDNKQNLPTNFTLTRKRLSNLQQTLKGKHPELIYKYNEQLIDQLKRGFIEQVLDPNIHEGVIHYIPHFPVFKESSTTAMRIVYDASAKISSKALSLNDCLHTGPNLIQRLQNMLLTFRSHKIAFTADIEKAFLQIELNTQDRDATRFLWLKDVAKSANNPDNLVVYRFCRVLFGAAPSPYLLNATIQHHLIKQNDWISEDLQRSIYMDNVLTGTNTIAEALEYYTSSRNCFQKAGMNLRQWTSNSPTLNRQAHDDGVHAEPMVKVLGLNWNTKTDTLSLSLTKLIKETNSIDKISKRSVLSLSSKLYDPMGFVEPVTVKAKIMMQELWKHNLTWDKELPDSFKENWVRWLNELQDLTPLEIPRQYFNNVGSEVQLHVFCDSSQLAYGAVAYLRGTTPKGGTKCTFVMSKSKVAPIKPQTMPRLELLAAVLGAELSKYLSNTILPKFYSCQIILWSDSQIVLSWISSSKPLRQQFIQHRVQLIRDITSQNTWKYCPTTSNPADLITRGMNAKAFISKLQYWNQGPPWLMKPTQEWPSITENQLPDSTENYTESQSISVNLASPQKSTNLLNAIDINKYSTLNKTLRVTALVIHFTAKLRKKTKSNTVTAIDMKHARIVLLQSVQQFYYGDILSQIKDKAKGKRPAIIHQLGLYLDVAGLIRCRGRLQYAQLPHNTKFPILIPKESHLSTLIVRATHCIVLHGGVRETLTELRQSYWIPKGRQLVKTEIRKCVTCRKVEGPPFRSVHSPPLPDMRVTGSQPFQVTGIDYAGPLYVRNVNKEVAKVYICLFTCTAIRAVHLELVEDQTAGAFLRAFKRFASRRGIPECIISDNAKTFKAGSQDLQALKTQVIEAAESQRFLANHGIKWKFITERAPWWGGFYERLIGLVKRRLKKMIRNTSLNAIELQTILTEIEATLNSRPLTYPYTDINDGPPLTPSHFLCGHRLLTLPDTEEDSNYIPQESAKDLTRRAKYHQKIMQAFWKQWQREYLTGLREQHSSQKNKNISGERVARGKVVLIHDETPRNQWKLGVIIQLHQGKDELVRSVTLRTAKGNLISRPIEKLYPLEVLSEEDNLHDSKEKFKNPEEIRSTSEKRTQRASAQRAALKIKELSRLNEL